MEIKCNRPPNSKTPCETSSGFVPAGGIFLLADLGGFSGSPPTGTVHVEIVHALMHKTTPKCIETTPTEFKNLSRFFE